MRGGGGRKGVDGFGVIRGLGGVAWYVQPRAFADRASTVLPNKRQTRERVPETLFHKSTTFIRNEKGEIVNVRSSTYESGREPSPTPKQRAKATKAMMEKRRAGK